MHSKTVLAYTAGILDGEGHFSIVWHKPINRYFGILGVMNTNLELLNWLQDTFGGSIYHRQQPSNKSHWKERYEWRATNLTMDSIIPLVLPYLKIKKPHARLMLDFRQTMGPPNSGGRGRAIDPNVLAKRKNLREQLLVLNDSHRAFIA
jgi:hypothetical protein